MISDISSIVTALSVFGTAIIALLGLRSWQNEMKGRAEYEIARKLMKDTYKLANELNNSRSPIQNIYYPNDSSLTEKEKNIKAYSKLYTDLFKPISNAYILNFQNF